MKQSIKPLLWLICWLCAFNTTLANIKKGTDSPVAPATNNQISAESEVTKAQNMFVGLDAQNQYRDGLNSFDDLAELPIGIRKKVGNNTIELAIASGFVDTDHAELTIYLRMTMPVTDPNDPSVTTRQLYFGADQIRMTRMGGLTGDFRAVLLGDFTIPYKSFTIKLKGGNGLSPQGIVNEALTYAEFSCGNGFKQARLVAEVTFPRTTLVPLDANNNFEPVANPLARVKGTFDFFSTKGLHDVLIQMNFNTPFAVAKYERFAFVVSNVALDLSTVNNPTNFIVPEGYPVTDNTWQGVYIQQFSLILPPEFKKKSTGERVGLTAQNILIDNLGFTGTVSAGTITAPVLPLDQGDASGWRFAVNRFSLSFFANQLRGGGFSGRISLPVNADSSAALAYDAAIDQRGNYRLSVSNLTDMNFKFMRAKATILRGSEVTLAVVNGQFRPRAVLHGNLGIYTNLADTHGSAIDTIRNNTLKFNGIRFENLVLQTEAPRLSFGYLAYEKSGNSVAKFPIVLEEFGITNSSNGNSILIGIGISVNLMRNSGGKGFNGRAFLTLEAREEQGEWKFVGIRRPIDITLDAEVSAFNLKGRIQLYENETERGFKGAIQLIIKKPKQMLICARAVFGYNFADQERYWYVDALGSGLGVSIAGPLVLDGFAGGLYSKFRPIGTGGTAATTRDCDGPNTGIPYAYDRSVGLGFRAAVLLKVTGSDNAFRGRVGFEMVLNRNYGISSVGFYGHGEVMVNNPEVNSNTAQLAKNFKNVSKTSADTSTSKPITQQGQLAKASTIDTSASAARPSGAIAFWVGFVWNLDKDELHGEAEAYASIGSTLRGAGRNGRIGRIELHFDPQKWYIHLGKPNDRLGVIVGFGSVAIRTTMYLMIGHGVPNQLPAPPPQVLQLIKIPATALARPVADARSILEGKGFAMGLDIALNTGPLQFGIFYAQFDVGAGADLLARKFSSFTCGSTAGSNGVYATGQFYVYLQGEVGIRVRRSYFTILSAGVAGLMQGGFPNPAWVSGYVGGRYSVLGGFVRGNFNLNVRVGNECKGI